MFFFLPLPEELLSIVLDVGVLQEWFISFAALFVRVMVVLVC